MNYGQYHYKGWPNLYADLLPLASNPGNLILQRGQCLVLIRGLDLVADLDAAVLAHPEYSPANGYFWQLIFMDSMSFAMSSLPRFGTRWPGANVISVPLKFLSS